MITCTSEAIRAAPSDAREPTSWTIRLLARILHGLWRVWQWIRDNRYDPSKHDAIDWDDRHF